MAAGNISSAVLKKDLSASRYVLATLGRHDGWGETTKHEHEHTLQQGGARYKVRLPKDTVLLLQDAGFDFENFARQMDDLAIEHLQSRARDLKRAQIEASTRVITPVN